MRRTSSLPVLLAALLVTNSCKAPAAKDTVVGPPEIETIGLVDGYMSAWNAHEAARAAAYMADDVVYFDATVGVPQVSRDSALKNVIQAFITAAPDSSGPATNRPRSSAPTASPSNGRSPAPTPGPFADGTKATGKKFSIKGATLMRLKDGKIAYQGDYYDAYGFLKQLGLAK